MLIHKTRQYRGKDWTGLEGAAFIPSRGPLFSLERLRDQFYFRGINRGLLKVQSSVNGVLLKAAERRKLVRKYMTLGTFVVVLLVVAIVLGVVLP